MKIFQILGHLCIVSDREFEKFHFEVKVLKKYSSKNSEILCKSPHLFLMTRHLSKKKAK